MAKRIEITSALRGASFEIQSLRRRNALLEARLSGIDDALALLFGNPGQKSPECGMAPCAADRAEKVAALIDAKAASKKGVKKSPKAASK